MAEVEQIKKGFIKETYLDTWNVYQQSLKSNIENWDYIVLTASNKEQAEVYRNEIDYRISKGKLSKNIKYLVVEDTEGKRIGSGGATINVLDKIKKESKKDNFNSLKILLIHSGGDSKRIPQYSCTGKLFSPVQRELPDGRSSTLFDEFIILFSAIPSRMSNGMVVLSGDVLLTFNPTQIDLHYIDSAGISIKVPANIGVNHGVFLGNEKDYVKKFLHKQSYDNLKKYGAINSKDYIDVDTGAIYFSSNILNDLYSLVCNEGNRDLEKYKLFVSEETRLSFYGDFIYPLTIEGTLEEFYKEQAENKINNNLIECRKKIWDKLNKYSMKIIKLSPSEFIHFGTTKELFDLLTKRIDKYDYLGWKRNVLCNKISNKECVANTSYIEEDTDIGKNVYIENSYIGKNVKIGNNVILSNVNLSDVTIPDDVCMNTIVTNEGKYITRIYAINDNPKTIKSNETFFLNSTFEKMMKKYNIEVDDIWSDANNCTIWNANLYTVENNNNDSIISAINLHNIMNCLANEQTVKDYFKKKRMSLYTSFNNSNTIKQKEENFKIITKIRNLNIIESVKSKEELSNAYEILLRSNEIESQIVSLLEEIDKYDYTIKSRIYLLISKVIKENKLENIFNEDYENKCYQEIKNTILSNKKVKQINSKIEKKNVKVEFPIRINFAGGWSDTPPYCNENGGIVLNGAFKLNGIRPIKVEIKKNDNKTINFISNDLDIEKNITDISELKICNNSNDIFSLIKASLIVTGVVEYEDRDIVDVIKRVGTGFSIMTDATTIPKGSGLGTSSILAASCIKAIYKFLNISITNEELIEATLVQEQLMETGGGWQDQIGSIMPGIKCIHTEPGIKQIFEYDNIKLKDKFKTELNERLVLIYTGQRRLAKNLLRNIISKYIYYDKNTVDAISEIKNKAIEMTENLRNGDIEEFANNLNKHWILSKKLDSGCSNTCIDQILVACDDLISGKMICGAGGGGFLQVILKKGINKEDLEERINDVFQDCGVKVYSVTLDEGEK